MVKKVGVAILGLGVVGGGTYQTIVEHHDFYEKTQQIDLMVEMVLDKSFDRLITLGVPKECIAKSIDEVVANPNVDIVVETIGGIGVAKEFVCAALRNGKTVVTSNKELICKFSHELEKLAKRNRCGLYYEASCVGGVPIIRTLLDGVQANNIRSMMGIVNGTTNYILTKMTYDGADYVDVLKEAQLLGYAEANPSLDVDGFDTAHKAAILAGLAYGKWFGLDAVSVEGIRNITQLDMTMAGKLGYRFKRYNLGSGKYRA